MDAPATQIVEPTPGEAAFVDGYYWSNDGLRLHYRDYRGGEKGVPVFCIPGLTRNARDFEDVAARIAAGGRRVIALDLRGRGESGYAPDPMSYVPLTYAQDVTTLADELGFDRFACVGTSLGGIVSMILAAMLPGRVAGVALNDVGPEVAPGGLARIRGYVGQGGTYRTWVHAARVFADQAGRDRFPDNSIADWLRLVKRAYSLTPEGRIAADYDAKIAEPFAVPGGETGVDLWPALDALRDIPVAIVRGVNSDILSADTAAKMLGHMNRATLVTIDRAGHAPTLEEPEAAEAIDAMLAAADAGVQA
jgi:pimeloyl-ACP methyl ester carboxylesterase